MATHERLDVVTIEYLLQNKKRSWESGLVILDSRETAEVGLRKLAGYKYLSAPVRFESDNKWRIIDVVDIAVALLSKTHSMSSPLGDICNVSGNDKLVVVEAERSILDGIEAMVKNNVHRVLVIKDNKPLDLFSQMDVIRWVVRNYDQIPESLRNQTAGNLQSMVVYVASTKEPVANAFRKMIEHKINGLAVVDEHGILVANLGIADLRGLQPENFEKMLSDTVEKFVHEMRQFLQKPPVVAQSGDKFENVLKMMQAEHIHRVFIINEHKKPTGVISSTDVMSYLLKSLRG